MHFRVVLANFTHPRTVITVGWATLYRRCRNTYCVWWNLWWLTRNKNHSVDRTRHPVHSGPFVHKKSLRMIGNTRNDKNRESFRRHFYWKWMVYSVLLTHWARRPNDCVCVDDCCLWVDKSWHAKKIPNDFCARISRYECGVECFANNSVILQMGFFLIEIVRMLCNQSHTFMTKMNLLSISTFWQ